MHLSVCCLVKSNVFFLISLFWSWFHSCVAHHSFYIIPDASYGGALGGVAIAEAVSADDELIHGVVVLLFDFSSGVQQVVSQRVKFSEIHSQVGDLQLV